MPLFNFGSGKPTSTPEATFWNWFLKNEDRLFNLEIDMESTFAMLSEAMNKVHPYLTFEFGPKRGNKREFIISADGMREALPKVQSLCAAAPQLPRWEVIAFRRRREAGDITFNGITIRAEDVRVLVEPCGPKVGVTVFIPGFGQELEDHYTNIAFIYLDHTLGEFDVITMIGSVNVFGTTSVPNGAVTLRELPETVHTFMSTTNRYN